MKYRPLGRTGIDVSVLCLGTMTWGEQNSAADAHRQLDFAVDAGINFIDTAELYATPVRPETQGRSGEILGDWLKICGRRDRLVIASKAAGPGAWVQHIRAGRGYRSRADLAAAVERSLRRLRTDHIDLYQLHWPDRDTNFFGRLGYRHAPDKDGIAIGETLQYLGELVDAGKIRQVGVSNETAWVVAEWLRAGTGGAGLCQQPRIHHQHHHRHDQPGTVAAEYRRYGSGTAAGTFARHRNDPYSLSISLSLMHANEPIDRHITG